MRGKRRTGVVICERCARLVSGGGATNEAVPGRRNCEDCDARAEALRALPSPSEVGAVLGARIRELRVAAGITQAELARRSGILRPNVRRLEAGAQVPTLLTLLALGTGLEVPLESLLEPLLAADRK